MVKEMSSAWLDWTKMANTGLIDFNSFTGDTGPHNCFPEGDLIS
jgi:hypothetical protein